MQNSICISETNKQQTPDATLRERIGSTVYEINIYFNNETSETMSDKVLRLARNDIHFPLRGVISTLPLTSWNPGRTS